MIEVIASGSYFSLKTYPEIECILAFYPLSHYRYDRRH